MAATEANAAPVVQEDGKTPETKQTETEAQPNVAEAETLNSNEMENKETVSNDTTAVAGGEEEEAVVATGDEAAAQSSENTSSVEPKTSFLDSFLNKSGLGKVMAGRKKKEEGGAAAEAGEKDGEKDGDEAPAADAEGAADGEAATENGEKEEEKKAEKGKGGDAKSTVRDLIRKPVARIFSHRSTEKKEGAASAAEPENPVKVRSKSLDRLENAEALNAAEAADTKEVTAAAAEEACEDEQKTSAAVTTKHMKRWHSFKKLMAQKTHRKSAAGEEGAEPEGGGGDSSTLDSKESGQKRWKLKRSWTFQGLKRDSSMVGISSKTKSADKPEEAAADGAEGEGVERHAEDAMTEAGEEKPERGEEEEKEEKAAAAGGATVTQHANEIWTSFKKRVIPKSKRANTECAASAEDDASAASTGDDGAADDAKDGKSAKTKRSHFGRAVSLKNFILRKGKSTSVDMSEGAKEDEEATSAEPVAAEAAAEEGGAEGTAAEAPVESNDKDTSVATEETPTPEECGEGAPKEMEKEAETAPMETPVTNGENGCSNGTAEESAVVEEHATHNHQDEEKTTGGSPVKKSKEAPGAKDDANAKIINATAAVNSDKKAGNA